jgi:CDP-diacylglycerol--serine O-phosphatidyltransferase
MKENKLNKLYFLPNLFTTFNLFCGFYAIIAVLEGSFFQGALAIIAAGIFDALDGRVARLTHTTSLFGSEYDSLCDLVSFGVAPALLVHQWALEPFGRYGWLAAFLYVATTALRLARFNTSDIHESTNYFTGLPCPAAAYMIATTYMFTQFLTSTGRVFEVFILALVYVLSYLMVSSHKYISCKKPESLKAKTFQGLVAMVLVIIVLATEPQVTFFLLALGYILSAPICKLYALLRHSAAPRGSQKDIHRGIEK